MPNNLTDNEIKKALETLLELVLVEGCLQRAKTISIALDLINRQGKENESLKAEVERLLQKLQQAEENEKRYNKLFDLLSDPLIIATDGNKRLKPVKRTSRQDVYHTVLKAQEIMKIPGRWFPWMRDGDNK